MFMGGAVEGTVTQETQMTDGTRGVINTPWPFIIFPRAFTQNCAWMHILFDTYYTCNYVRALLHAHQLSQGTPLHTHIMHIVA